MERYTYFKGGKWWICVGETEDSGPWVDRLAAYEDTGLEPEDCMAYSDVFELRMYRRIGSIPELQAMKEARDEGHRIEPWVVCFRCDNRRSPTCLKCTRNAFAPCGVEKDDHFTRAEAEAAIGGGGDGCTDTH